MKARDWRLTVEGEISGRVGQAFSGMVLTHEGGNTVLVGRIRDQAELHGHLQRVSDLGLTLLDATVVDEPSGPRRPVAEPPPAQARPSDTRSDR